MLLQFPLLRNNALKNATCRQNEPFNEEHQDLSAEQFLQMMFQVGVYLEAGDTLLEKSKGEKQIEKSPVRRSLLVGGGPNVISVLLLVARKDHQEYYFGDGGHSMCRLKDSHQSEASVRLDNEMYAE